MPSVRFSEEKPGQRFGWPAGADAANSDIRIVVEPAGAHCGGGGPAHPPQPGTPGPAAPRTAASAPGVADIPGPADATAVEGRAALVPASPLVPPLREIEAGTAAVAHRQEFGLLRDPGWRREGAAGAAFASPGRPSNPIAAAIAKALMRIHTSLKTQSSVNNAKGPNSISDPLKSRLYPEAPREVAAESTGA